MMRCYFFAALIEEMYDWLKDDVIPPTPHLLRFMSHLLLFFRTIGVSTKVRLRFCVKKTFSPTPKRKPHPASILMTMLSGIAVVAFESSPLSQPIVKTDLSLQEETPPLWQL